MPVSICMFVPPESRGLGSRCGESGGLLKTICACVRTCIQSIPIFIYLYAPPEVGSRGKVGVQGVRGTGGMFTGLDVDQRQGRSSGVG